MKQTVTIRGDVQRRYAAQLCFAAPDGAVIHVLPEETSRTAAQNRTIHKWFGEIAKAGGDQTPEEVKASCNLTYGRPILARDDPEWSAAFGYLFDALSHAAKLKAIRLLDVPFTRRMTVAQLSEYMGAMRRDYAEAGIYLTDPELQGMAR